MTVKKIAKGYHTITPYLVIKGADAAIDFYVKAFGAVELYRLTMPGGQGVAHAELQIGDSRFMLSDEWPDFGNLGPLSIGGTSTTLMLAVENVDDLSARAEAAGAQIERPVADQFYGERSCTLRDPFGHRWMISTHIEDVSPAEMQTRMDAMMASGKDS